MEITPDGEVVDSPLTMTERIDLAESEAELETLWAEARTAGSGGAITRRGPGSGGRFWPVS